MQWYKLFFKNVQNQTLILDYTDAQVYIVSCHCQYMSIKASIGKQKHLKENVQNSLVGGTSTRTSSGQILEQLFDVHEILESHKDLELYGLLQHCILDCLRHYTVTPLCWLKASKMTNYMAVSGRPHGKCLLWFLDVYNIYLQQSAQCHPQQP